MSAGKFLTDWQPAQTGQFRRVSNGSQFFRLVAGNNALPARNPLRDVGYDNRTAFAPWNASTIPMVCRFMPSETPGVF